MYMYKHKYTCIYIYYMHIYILYKERYIAQGGNQYINIRNY